jgi:hypothetical protein
MILECQCHHAIEATLHFNVQMYTGRYRRQCMFEFTWNNILKLNTPTMKT